MVELIRKDGKIVKMVIRRDFGGNIVVDNPAEFNFNRTKQSFTNLKRSVEFYRFAQKFPYLRLTFLKWSRFQKEDEVHPMVQFLNGRKVKITIEVVE